MLRFDFYPYHPNGNSLQGSISRYAISIPYGIHIYRTILDFRCLTYMDNKKVNVELPVEEDRKKMLKWARFTFVIALTCLVSAAIQKIMYVSGSSNATVLYLENIGFEALFFFGALISSISLFLYSNSKDVVKDPKSLVINLELFKTNKGFAIGAIGICAIYTILYVMFW